MLADTLLLMVTEAPIASPVVAWSFIILKLLYAERIIAFWKLANGKLITKLPLDVVLSSPKSSTAIAGFVTPSALYINAPRAVIDVTGQVTVAKLINATPFVSVGYVDMVST
jgi:chromosome segregation ATPase